MVGANELAQLVAEIWGILTSYLLACLLAGSYLVNSPCCSLRSLFFKSASPSEGDLEEEREKNTGDERGRKFVALLPCTDHYDPPRLVEALLNTERRRTETGHEMFQKRGRILQTNSEKSRRCCRNGNGIRTELC